MIDIPFQSTCSMKPNAAKIEQVYKFLTPGQQQLLTMLFALKKGQVARVAGYAGTGKTFAIGWYVRLMAETYNTIAVCAPTHNAKDVLIEKINLSKDVSNVVYATIQSLLSLEEVQDPETGVISFRQKVDMMKGDVPIEQNRIVVIDEGSMLCPVLSDLIHKSWLTAKFKLIIVGDPVQVPPPGYNDSFVFTEDFDELFSPKDFELDEIVRQGKGSDIINLSFEIRKNLTMGADAMLELCRKYTKNGGDVVPLDSLNSQIFPIYKSDGYKQNPRMMKTISFRNDRCREYSNAIRNYILGKNVEEPEIGDTMMFNEPYIKKSDILFKNKEEVFIIAERNDTYTFNYKTFDVNIYTVKRLKTGEYNEDDNLSDEEEVIHMRSYEMNRFKSEVSKFAAKIRSLPLVQRPPLWKIFWSQKRIVANWVYIYTLTAHKSQGGTFDYTVVDVYDILNNPNVIVRNRILYTAVTRASKKTYLRVFR